MSLVGVGLALHPDHLFLDLVDGLARQRVDYYEVAPETLWVEAPGGFAPNAFHERLRELVRETDKPVVAHGVALSIGSQLDSQARRGTHLRQLARDAECFRFLWLTDHAGANVLADENTTLPLPVPMTAHSAALLQRRLEELRAIVPHVGLENTCHYFLPGDPLEEPRWLSRALAAQGSHLLLDLHNLWTMAQNLDFDPQAYLAQLDLDRVIELHVSGGADSDPRWLPDGATLRLDGHDSAVPEPVFALLELVVPRCRNLRGVTLERMEGTVDARSVAALGDELTRIHEVLAA